MKPSNYIVIGITAFFAIVGIYSTTQPYINTSTYNTNLKGHRGFEQKIAIFQTIRQGGSSNYSSTSTDYSSSSYSSSSSSSYDYDSDDDRDYSGGGSSYGK
jgi:uncharacterized membrane protein YgcG